MILDDEFISYWRPLVRKRLKRKIGDFPLEDLDDVESQVFEAFTKAAHTESFKGKYGEGSTWRFLETVVNRKCADLIKYQKDMKARRGFDPRPRPSLWETGSKGTNFSPSAAVAHLYSDDDVHPNDWLENRKPVPFYCPKQRLKFAISWFATYPNHVLEMAEAERTIRKSNREIVSRYREGYTRKEIAANAGLAGDQVKGRLERDKKKILKRAIFPST